MPIDPSITLGIRPAQFNVTDPIEQYGKAVSLKALMGQGQLQDMQIRQAQQGLDDENAVRDAYKVAGGDSAKLRDLLIQRGAYKQVQAQDKFALEQQKTQAGINKDNADASGTKSKQDIAALAHGANLLANSNNQADYEAAISIIDRLSPGAGANLLKVMPTFDPAKARQLAQAGLTRAEQLEAENKAATLKETGRHNLASEGLTARGQNMTDSRARELNQIQKDAGRREIKENGDGTFTLIDKGTGQSIGVVDQNGQPLRGKPKELTESQGKATGLALRAQRANEILNNMEDAGHTTRGNIKQAVGGIPLVGTAAETGVNMLPSWAGGPSGPQQQVEQARRDFVNAALRVESGASISEGEFRNAERQYFPMPGDTPTVIAQKRRNRETEIESLKLQGGPGAAKVTSAPKARGVDPTKLSDAELKRELGL
jgi:hypothetical protein